MLILEAVPDSKLRMAHLDQLARLHQVMTRLQDVSHSMQAQRHYYQTVMAVEREARRRNCSLHQLCALGKHPTQQNRIRLLMAKELGVSIDVLHRLECDAQRRQNKDRPGRDPNRGRSGGEL